MRVCPKCGYQDPFYWRQSFNNNPEGNIDVARINELKIQEPMLARKIEDARGSTICVGIYCYLLGKRAVWVKRVWKKLYEAGGESVWRVPHERSMRFSALKVAGQKKLCQ